MSTGERAPLGQRLRRGMRTYRFPISIVVFAVGILMIALALGDFTPLGQTSVFKVVNPITDQSVNASGNSTGGPNYNLAFAVLGPIIFIVGAYLVGAYLVARRRFEHLMETKSKAEFLRNIPDLEETLWELTPADETRYAEKRSELKVRR
ncbi:MAG TPA: DUF3198 domain-containing protein [Thermoplasmata archaeon]|nr:DUF3198 domain-containing protein [Thermoplasmata archaeon]